MPIAQITFNKYNDDILQTLKITVRLLHIAIASYVVQYVSANLCGLLQVV